MGYTPGQEFQQVVVTAAHQVSFDHFVDRADAGFELDEVLAMMVVQGDFGEDRDGLAELGEVDAGIIAEDVTGFLQAFYPQQTRARLQGDGLGQVDVGNAAVTLQLRQDVDIDPIELQCGHHDVNLKCGPARTAPGNGRGLQVRNSS